jgi:hypothetical protein
MDLFEVILNLHVHLHKLCKLALLMFNVVLFLLLDAWLHRLQRSEVILEAVKIIQTLEDVVAFLRK